MRTEGSVLLSALLLTGTLAAAGTLKRDERLEGAREALKRLEKR